MEHDQRVAGEDEGGGLIVLNGWNVWNFRIRGAKGPKETTVKQ
jgi:hypothetical protein